MYRFLPQIIHNAQVECRTNDELKKRLVFYLKSISMISDPEKRLEFVREEIDKTLESIDSSCEKGCHFCCYHPIGLAKSEMRSIKEFSPRFSQARLEQQIDFYANNIAIEYEQKKCVFLDNGQCGVYAKRPLVCRLAHVKSDPANCQLSNQSQNIEQLSVQTAAVIAVAFYQLNPEVELIPISLTQ